MIIKLYINDGIKVHIWLNTYLDNGMNDESDSPATEGTKISANKYLLAALHAILFKIFECILEHDAHNYRRTTTYIKLKKV